MSDRPNDITPPLRGAIENDPRVVLLDVAAEVGVAAIRGQLLVHEAELSSAGFASELRAVAEQVAVRHTDEPAPELKQTPHAHADVGLWQLKKDENLVEVIRRLRDQGIRPGRAHVSPNHLLVPCPPHWCPAVAPSPTSETIEIPSFDCEPVVDVVVIDAGWVDVPLLAARGGIDVVTPSSALSAAAAGMAVGGAGVLPAISGHATFIVGEIAAQCSNARFLVVNHPDPWVDEWSVAASLARWAGAQCDRVPDVVSCGFAMATLDNRPSFAFGNALGQLAATTAVVSPAGNQASTLPHWPAAFKRVVGVGAFDETNGNAMASFSNHGPWVDCAAGGVGVVSTFIKGTWTPQDADPQVPVDFGDFASWSGTSFSTPRFTAAVAARLAKARANHAATNGRRVAHKLAAGLVPELVLGSDLDLGTKLDLP
ncbi:MAG: S8/S53 family peptidase [Gaiellales bacterium]